MAEAELTTGGERPRYVVYGGPWERDAVLDYVAQYDGPEDAEFPGCVPIPMTAEQFEEYDGGVEYWSRDLGMAWVARDGGPDHENARGHLPALLTRVALERGSPIRCWGGLRMVVVDRDGRATEAMHPDQSVYLHPSSWTPSGRQTVIGSDRPPDVVLEVDHTTDVRRKKLGIYHRWGVPEVWVETPDAPSPSRPRGVVPGLSIYVLEDDDYGVAPVSAALPTWEAYEIHAALNEPSASADTIENLVRVGRVLGDIDGTGPMDDVQIAGYMRRAHGVGQRTGFARGRELGHASGLAEGRRNTLASTATELLRLRGITLSDDTKRRLATTTLTEEALLAAAMGSSTEPDFRKRLALDD
ncbi:MAG: Uma2 family endonuclease [Gammaproteobacteria bacterium]|nr:Uma2 family endonuclease [Gammaproteobacteria bacterium]